MPEAAGGIEALSVERRRESRSDQPPNASVATAVEAVAAKNRGIQAMRLGANQPRLVLETDSTR
jgi:hypothetical protein